MRGFFLRFAAAFMFAAMISACANGDAPSEPILTAEPSATTHASATTQPAEPVKILALGDSYTIGERVDKLEKWPVQLVRKLRVNARGAAEPTILAVSGWDTADLIDALNRSDFESSFDVVTLQIGVNNQFRNGTISSFEDDLARLTTSAVGLAGGDANRVILVSIPDWGVTPFAEGAPTDEIAEAIDAFNDVIRAQAGESGTKFVDVTPISRRAATERELIAADGLHPSGAMYAEWVGLIYPVIEEILANSS